MSWTTLDNIQQLEALNLASAEVPQLIFKHSTRCGTSGMVKNRLFKKELPSGIDFYYLDLIANREISNKISEIYRVRHESPQVLLIKEGKCTYNESHSAIYMDDIEAEAM